MQWRKRWNDDTLLGRRNTSTSAGHFSGEFRYIEYSSGDGNGAASRRPPPLQTEAIIFEAVSCHGRIQRPSVTLFSSPELSLICAVESTVIVKSQSGSKQAAGMGTGASIVRWADCKGSVGMSLIPPGEKFTRVIDAGAFPWPWFWMTIRS